MASQARFTAVDTLRGLAILGMALSGMVPDKGLPAWMFHAQLPPPDHNFDPKTYGITWVDLVFPYFLFAMGVAIPFAYRSSSSDHADFGKLLLGWLQRGFLLFAFAVLGQHTRPFSLASSPGAPQFAASMIAFGAMVLMFLRWPKFANKSTQWTVTLLGWAIMGAVLYKRVYADGTGFRFDRADIILVVLANVAVSGSAIWYFTRAKQLVRLGIMAMVAAVVLTCTQPGLSKAIWDWHPLPLGYYYQFEYHKYLLVVLPGTLVGDMFIKWSQVGDPESNSMPRWSNGVLALLALLGFSAQILACIGMLSRDVIPTSLALMVLTVIMAFISHNPGDPNERLVRDLVSFGTIFTTIGLLVEPIGGGIRKDSPTMSYYLLTSGLAALFLVTLVILHQIWRKDKALSWLSGTGSNPMLAYICITHLVMAGFRWAGLESLAGTVIFDVLGGSPWYGVAWGGIKTLFIALVCWGCSTLKIFLRA